jgi:putative nucleotidyltransferase with HDIG domain
MKRILFVDDEQQILDGLRNLLRKQRGQWEMAFALGGQAALDELSRGTFDVVVSDMRMPGIDGVALLRRVKELYPATARIILSGHAEREAVINALPVAHQFLSKPCDAEVLRSVVERAFGLQKLLQDETVRGVIGKVDRLPSIPKTYWDLNQAASLPNIGLVDLAKIVEQDAALATKVLQLVNSSYFGLAQRQTSLQQAVAYLGTELLKALALTAHVFIAADLPAVKGFSLDDLQQHSVRSARIAKRLLSDKQRASEAFTAALVHDIGKIVLAMSKPDIYAQVIVVSRETKRADHVVEKELFGVTHAEVGAYLLGLWGLPLSVVEAVAYHHHPELTEATDILVAVHVANALSHPQTGSVPDPTAGGRLNLEWIEASVYASELPRWRRLAEEEIHAANRDA